GCGLMTVRFYSSLDAGSPALIGSRLIDQVKQILIACLVNGYGSKLPAGWTVGHEHSDGFSLSNGEGFINLVNLAATAYVAYIMESITDGTTALAGGINRRSGRWYDGSAATQRQVINTSSFVSGTNKHWHVVADDKSCVLMLGCQATTADVDASQGVAHIFGRYINALGLSGFCSLGGADASSGGASGALQNFAGALLRHPFTGLIDQGTAPLYACMGAGYQAAAVTSRATLQPDVLTLIRAGVMGIGAGVSGGSIADTAVFSGRLRGVVSDPVLCGAKASQVLPLLGSNNTWQARVTAISLANGKQLVPLFPSGGDRGYFVSLDPSDWE
ncbi:hypothetical protein V2S84_08975, partial [Azotobacter chroococcum]|nr:hypothetical protein [Azotobacter chroococcum]